MVRVRDEAEATIKKDSNGKYKDRYKTALTKRGIKKLTDKQMNALFKTLRLRISLVSNCNLQCLFCSNEGSCYASRSYAPPHLDKIIKLCNMLIKNTPLSNIDISGGEPLLHPDFIKKEYKFINWIKTHPQIRFSLHTNGINLSPEVIDLTKDAFSRIGISLHSVNFITWNKITNPNGNIPIDIQKNNFIKIMSNIQYLGNKNVGNKVFIKSVVIRGLNDSEEEIRALFDFCEKYGFHPKLLQFDPQYPSQVNLQVKRKELFEKMEKIGVTFDKNVPFDNDPNTYIPGINFNYGTAPMGLHSIFGCGDFAACKSCYNFLCMFVKFSEDGSRVYLKPCSTLDTQIDLTHTLDTDNFEQLFDLFKMSREYLMLSPGMGVCGWNKEEKYEPGNK